jgi:hypothetical protein
MLGAGVYFPPSHISLRFTNAPQDTLLTLFFHPDRMSPHCLSKTKNVPAFFAQIPKKQEGIFFPPFFMLLF